MDELTKKTIFYMISHIKNYKRLFFIMIFTIILAAIFMGVLTILVQKQIFDLLVSDFEKDYIVSQALIFLAYFFIIQLFANIFWRTAGFLNTIFQPAIMRDIENDVFDKFQKHSFGFFADNFSGSLVTKTNRLTRSFETITDRLYWDFLPLIVIFVFSFGVIFYFVPIMAVIIFIWTIIYLSITLSLYRIKYKKDLELSNADSKVTGELADSLTNIFNTKVFAKSEFEKKRFSDTTFSRFRLRKNVWGLTEKINILQGVLMFVAETILIYTSIILWSKGQMSIGTIFLVQSYALGIMQRLWNIGRFTGQIFEATADAKEMIEIIDTDLEVEDPKNPEKCFITEGEIKFKDVNFNYGSKKIFSSFNLNIKSKESIGLVGESGAGKSTITKMLLRFSDISSGEILIDSQNISNITQEDLRSKISYVPQDSILFHRTILENISYSNPDAKFEDIVKVAKKANIHNFIDSLPEKYNTYVGERGVKLSGGERQRIAIARAMLKDAPIIILDEATSSLDSKSEKLIQQALENLVKNKTTIVIAHRLSTIKMLDRILVIEKGKILEQGNHKELIKKKGKYHELWEHQTSNI